MSSHCKNGHIILKQRPGKDGEPHESNFEYLDIPYPSGSLSDGQLLIKNLLLSVDPALRCRMNEDSGADYLKAWEIDKTITGIGGIGEVVESANENFQSGDLVIPTFEWPWKKYFTKASNEVQKPPKEMLSVNPKLFLSLLGVTGLTAYLGITERGHITKGSNQSVVVTAAAGSTGMLAGQVAKAEGCGLLVGICGSDAKCKVIVKELGFDAAINYRTENVNDRLKSLCPKGVDIYFDNVGGVISNTIIKQMTTDSHVILCGQIAVYNKDVPYPPPIPKEITDYLTQKNITRERFLVLTYKDKFASSLSKLMELYLGGKIKVKETIECGLENAPKAFVSMMSGGNVGKQIVQVAESF